MSESQGGLGELFARFTTQISKLFRAEIALTKAQAKAVVQHFATAGILLAVALVLALYMLGRLIRAMFLSWQLAILSWAAALLTAAVLAVLAVILGVVGYAALKKAQRHLPNPTEGVETDVGIIESVFKPTTEEDR